VLVRKIKMALYSNKDDEKEMCSWEEMLSNSLPNPVHKLSLQLCFIEINLACSQLCSEVHIIVCIPRDGTKILFYLHDHA
jgi:hypothetical protein